MAVPFIDLTRQHAALATELAAAVGEVFAGAQFILGANVRALEEELAAYCGVGQAIGVGSGSDALVLILRALGIGPGDEVVVPAFTFVATAEAVTHVGATPVFADIDPVSFTLDVEDAARKVTSCTRAVIPVHLYGLPCDMTSLRTLAARHDLAIVEDAAQAIGAEHRGARAGALGRAACFSFFPTKNLGACGDAGLVTTDDADLAARVRMLRDHGSRERYFHEMPGWASRLDELQAAVLRVKFRRLDAWTMRRRVLAERYRALLNGLPLAMPEERAGDRHVYHLFTVRTPRRDELKKFLDDRGIGSAIHYPIPVHKQPLYRGLTTAPLPESERASREVLSLPLYPEIEAHEVEAVAAALREFFVQDTDHGGA
jgi:dTDP-4-amino-4,6-dideoxygalactose transaminase